MIICCLCLIIVPLNRTITVTRDEFLFLLWFPCKSRTWITSQACCVADIYDLSFVDVVHTNLSVRTRCTYILVIGADFKREYFGVSITKKVYKTRLIIGIIEIVKFEETRTITFLFFDMLSL